MELGVTDKNVVGFAFDEFTDDVQAQLVRDLIILLGDWDFSVSDPNMVLNQPLLDQLGVVRADANAQPTLVLVYKVGPNWPEVKLSIPQVKRDLSPEDNGQVLDCNPHVGYYLNEQGREGANRTEQYLNRAYPKGKGLVNPMVTLIWG
jgi:hypothetical protein